MCTKYFRYFIDILFPFDKSLFIPFHFFLQEFDKQAAKTVQYFFDEIDSVLYEQNLEGPLYIRKECKEWNLRFLHLR